MGNREFGDRREPDEARSRIDRIRQGSGAEADQPADDAYYEEQPQVPSRARGGRGAPEPDYAPARPSGRGSQALIFIGAIVGIGVVVVLALALLSGVFGGGQGLSLPFLATATPLPTATFTPSPTPTETPTPTPTPPPPRLSLPPLTCIFQSGAGCFDYCGQAANKQECDGARDFVRAQGADPDFWLNCIAPSSGPNVGNPQQCLIDAWYAAQNP